MCVEDIGQSRDLMLVICCEKGCFSDFCTMGMQECNVEHSASWPQTQAGEFVFCIL